MALIIEDGSIVLGANTYVTGEELVVYAAARGITIPLPSVPDTPNPAPTTSYANALGQGDRTLGIALTTTVLFCDGYLGNQIQCSGTLDNIVDGSSLAATSGALLKNYSPNVDGMYIQFDFGVKKYIDEFGIRQSGSWGNWKIESSNDENTWVTQKESFLMVASPSSETPYSFVPDVPLGYRYWRLTKVGTNGNIGNWFTEVTFKIADGAAVVPPILDLTAENLLVKAMDYIESLIYIGLKRREDQPLQWPRFNVYIDGYILDQDEIPKELKKGLYETALAINANNDPLRNIERVQDKVSVGSISVEYSTSSSSQTTVRKLSASLRKIVKGGLNGISFSVDRS